MWDDFLKHLEALASAVKRGDVISAGIVWSDSQEIHMAAGGNLATAAGLLSVASHHSAINAAQRLSDGG